MHEFTHPMPYRSGDKTTAHGYTGDSAVMYVIYSMVYNMIFLGRTGPYDLDNYKLRKLIENHLIPEWDYSSKCWEFFWADKAF